MDNPVKRINSIANKDDFLNFVSDLAMDAKEHPEEWVNNTLTDYIEQMASWIDDSYPYNHNIDWKKVDYKTFAKILYMGKIYE